MATTIKKPVRLSAEYASPKQFQTEEAVGPEHGGTGKTLTDLTGKAGEYLKVNSGEDGFEFDTPAGGGGGGDSLGTGFTSGGGNGTIPDETTATLAEEGTFQIKWHSGGDAFNIWDNPDVGTRGIYLSNNSGEVTMQLSNNGFVFTDGLNGKGAIYAGDYSSQALIDERSIPDVGTTKLIVRNGPPQYTTTERDALSPSAGWMIYNTTVNKLQCYDGSTWNNLW